MSVAVSSLSVLAGLALGIGVRVLAQRLMGDDPRTFVLWAVELGLAFILGALTGVPLASHAERFVSADGALGLTLTAYAMTCGLLAFIVRNPRRARSLALGFAHFVAASVAACAGLVLAVMTWHAG